jgi:hypothetical protein
MVAGIFLSSGETVAQKAIASIDTTSIRIGEQILLKIDVTLPKAARISWPAFSDTVFAPVEIVKQTKVDTLETNRVNYLQYKQVLAITSFDTGYHTIPPIQFNYRLAGDTSKQLAVTDSLILHVRTIEVDTTRSIKDIKAPLQAPLTLAELWPFFGALAVVGLIAGFIWYYLWRRKMKKPLFPMISRPQLPPWQTALESLQSLESRKLWQSGKIKEYYTELTDILRVFIEKQHQIPAMEMISSEIIQSLEDHDSLHSAVDKIGKVLQLADLVKFAKEQPLPSDHELSLSNTRSFIMETRPTVTEKPAEKQNTEETSTV